MDVEVMNALISLKKRGESKSEEKARETDGREGGKERKDRGSEKRGGKRRKGEGGERKNIRSLTFSN